MAEIKVLSQHVADKIAAGEVAERPSAVVKELMENAIDAGADEITVEIKKGGVELIKVIDNGGGIPPEYVETAFLRHATSKLREIDDLNSISTMGFRGEALASICAVSDVEVITKTKDKTEGTYLKLEHGTVTEKDDIACNDGTIMIVNRLFYNVPARMKFLKKDSTEAGYVTDLVGRIALSHPEISIKYIVDDKEIFITNGDGQIRNVVLQIYGIEASKAMLDVGYTENGVCVCGVAGKPEISRGNRTRQTLFVNNRYVKNHVLSKIIEEAYRNSVMVGKFPIFIISVMLSPNLVDVNVHPAKTEIKFANEKEIYNIVYHAVKNALCDNKAEHSISDEKRNNFEMPIKSESSQSVQFNLNLKSEKSYMPHNSAKLPDIESYIKYTTPLKRNEESVEKPIIRTVNEVIETPEVEVTEQEIVSREKIIGQVFDTYIITQKDDVMYLIDQHAAHERLRFEKLCKDYREKRGLGQVLLTPVVMDIDFSEKQILKENLSEFEALGFEIEEFGNNAIIIRQTPINADDNEIKELVCELLEAFDENKKTSFAKFEERLLDTISCKYAIKANKKLSPEEMKDLVDKLNELNQKGVTTCPHGRPIRVPFSKYDIEKMFKRIV